MNKFAVQKPTVTVGVRFSVYFEYSDDIDPLWLARDVSAMINMVGCPLLLTGMCVERYLAVVKPVLYLKSRKLKHRLALSFAVWCITSMSCVSMGKYWPHRTVAPSPSCNSSHRFSLFDSSLGFFLISCSPTYQHGGLNDGHLPGPVRPLSSHARLSRRPGLVSFAQKPRPCWRQ